MSIEITSFDYKAEKKIESWNKARGNAWQKSSGHNFNFKNCIENFIKDNSIKLFDKTGKLTFKNHDSSIDFVEIYTTDDFLEPILNKNMGQGHDEKIDEFFTEFYEILVTLGISIDTGNAYDLSFNLKKSYKNLSDIKSYSQKYYWSDCLFTLKKPYNKNEQTTESDILNIKFNFDKHSMSYTVDKYNGADKNKENKSKEYCISEWNIELNIEDKKQFYILVLNYHKKELSEFLGYTVEIATQDHIDILQMVKI